MNSQTPLSSPESAERRQGTFSRLTGALISPRETFADIARHPTWLAPVILLTLLSLSITILFTQQVGWERFMRRQIALNPDAAARMEQIPAERRAEVIRQQATISKYFGYGIGTIGQLTIVLLVAAVMLGAFNLIAGAGVSYRQSLGITSHAFVPGVIAGLQGLLVIYFSHPDDVDLQNLIIWNLGTALPEDAPRWLLALASSVDLFSFWTIALLAIGFRAAAPKKVSTAGALGIVLIPWGLYVLGKTALVAIFS